MFGQHFNYGNRYLKKNNIFMNINNSLKICIICQILRVLEKNIYKAIFVTTHRMSCVRFCIARYIVSISAYCYRVYGLWKAESYFTDHFLKALSKARWLSNTARGLLAKSKRSTFRKCCFFDDQLWILKRRG